MKAAAYSTLGGRLETSKGIGPGFDFLRIGLSLAILLWHSFSNSYGLSYAESLPKFPIPPLLSSLLPMFFGLSGFLVIGSALRTQRLGTFILFRALRIVPALFAEIMISAFLLGPALTTLSLKNYFSNPTFFEYFGSLIGRVRFTLPGLFETNPTPDFVNFALWTVGPEILCYVAMALLMLTNIYRKRNLLVGLVVLYAIVCVATDVALPPKQIAEVLPAKLLIFSFLIGACIFLYRDMIPYSVTGAALAFATATVLIYLGQRTGSSLPRYISAPAYVYAVAVLGLTKLPRLPLLDTGDYSYGVYIFGFPIQQSIAYFFPERRDWLFNFGIALPLTLIVAVASWHFIEKPSLGLRKRIRLQHSTSRGKTRLWAIVAISLYGAFLIDANSVFPVRQIIKMMIGRDIKGGQADLRPASKFMGIGNRIADSDMQGKDAALRRVTLPL